MSQDLTEFLTYRVLDQKFTGHSLLDDLMETQKVDIPMKNMCAKVSHEFDQNVSDMADFLGIRKAEFIRRAVLSAMVEAEEIMKQYLDQDSRDRAPHFVQEHEEPVA